MNENKRTGFAYNREDNVQEVKEVTSNPIID